MEQLNNDFGNSNGDLSLTPVPFYNLSADTDIEFKLATIDPDGNCTDGINRIYTDSVDYVTSYYPKPHWPSNKYFNIYIVASLWDIGTDGIPNAISGQGWFPNSFNLRDGIYLQYRTVLFSPLNSQTLLQRGTIITHEAGHWLNLYHIWGNNNGGNNSCTDSDSVTDTPNQAGPSNTGGSPTQVCFDNFPLITCNNEPNGNMFCNFMDYSSCRTMFTEGQKNRMLNALDASVRYPVWQPDNLIATGVNIGGPSFSCPSKPKADFACDQRFIIGCEPNISVSFKERCFQSLPNSLQWHFPGGTPSVSTNLEVSVEYATSGNYDVTLIAQNSYGSDTIQRTVHVQGIPSNVYPATSEGENFELANDIADVGAVFEYLGNINFELCNTTGYNSSKSIKCPKAIFLKIANANFVTHKFEIGQQDSILNFKIAYLNGNADSYLYVYARTNCLSDSSIARVGVLYSPDLISSTVGLPSDDFNPVSDEEWKDIQFVIPQKFRGRDDVQFTFRYVGLDANNFFIDDIKVINASAVSTQNLVKYTTWSISPNPSSDFLSIRFDGKFSIHGLVTICDLCGRVLFEHEASELSGNIFNFNLPSGGYICKIIDLEGKEFFMPKKLLINRR